MGSKTGRMEFYDVEVSSLDGNYKMDVKLAKVEKPELISINNPGYEKLICKYNHLKDVIIEDSDEKDELPIHLVLGNGEYVCIKTTTRPLIGGDNEPVAE